MYFDDIRGSLFELASIIDQYGNIVMFIAITLIVILILVSIIMYLKYDYDKTKLLENIVLSFDEIDYADIKPTELGCLRNGRLANKRDAISVILILIQKKVLKLEKDLNGEYYIEKQSTDVNSLSLAESYVYRAIEFKRYNLEYFISFISSRYTIRRIINEINQDNSKKFDIVQKPLIFNLMLNALLILILAVVIVAFGFTAPDEESYVSDYAYLFIVFAPLVLVASFSYRIINRSATVLSEKEDLMLYIVKKIVAVTFLCIVFFISNIIGLVLTLAYAFAEILVFKNKSSFVNVKKEYLKQKAEAMYLEKYLKEYSLLDEKELSHIILYDEYLIFAFVLGITLKVDKELNLYVALLEDRISMD